MMIVVTPTAINGNLSSNILEPDNTEKVRSDYPADAGKRCGNESAAPFSLPRTMCTDETDYFYVSRSNVFEIKKIPVDVENNPSTSLVIASDAFAGIDYHNENLWVVNTSQNRVDRYDTSGNFIAQQFSIGTVGNDAPIIHNGVNVVVVYDDNFNVFSEDGSVLLTKSIGISPVSIEDLAFDGNNYYLSVVIFDVTNKFLAYKYDLDFNIVSVSYDTVGTPVLEGAPDAMTFLKSTGKIMTSRGGITPTRLCEMTPETMTFKRNYVPGNTLIDTSTHRSYECLISTNDDPLVGVKSTPATWIDTGGTNKFKMFDNTVSSQSSRAFNIDIDIDYNGSPQDSVSAFNVYADDVVIEVTDSVAGIVYHKEIDMLENEAAGCDLGLQTRRNMFALFDLPANYPNATIRATFIGNPEVRVGELVLGKQAKLGVANYGTSVQLLNYDRVDVDEFGTKKITKRRKSRSIDYDVTINTNCVTHVLDKIAELTAIPCVWSGSDENENTVVFGYYKDSQINISTPSVSECSIQIEGLT